MVHASHSEKSVSRHECELQVGYFLLVKMYD